MEGSKQHTLANSSLFYKLVGKESQFVHPLVEGKEPKTKTKTSFNSWIAPICCMPSVITLHLKYVYTLGFDLRLR